MSRIPPTVPLVAAWIALGSILPGVAGDWGLFPLLGVLPGLVLATVVPLERGALARWSLGLAASPLVVTLTAWAAMGAGLPIGAAARLVAFAFAILWVVVELRRGARESRLPRSVRGERGRSGTRFAWAWALGAAFVVAFVLFANPYLQVRADGWIHGGIIHEILGRGIPPEDPRFAGLTLNYVWFHNYFVALLVALKGGDPFAFMALSNVAAMFSMMGVAWLLGRQVWRTARAAQGAAVLMGLAFNAGMWILWPLRLVRAYLGNDRGPDELARILASGHWNDAEVIYDLSPYGAYMVNFLDKPLHGTAINVAYGFLLVHLWALVRAMRGQRRAAWTWGAIGASGMLYFHGVVGLSAIPVSLATVGLAFLLRFRVRWLPPPSRTIPFALATVLGALSAAPYTIAIFRAWPAAAAATEKRGFHLDPTMWITLASALAVAAWFARRAPARLVARRRGPGAVLALYTLAMLAFACVVTLPIGSHAKFVLQVFFGLVVLGGAFLHDELAAWRRRLGPVGTALLVAILLGTPVLTLRGYLLDRTEFTRPEHPMRPGEPAVYAWIRASTPVDAVFVDDGFRDVIMVEGRRQLLLGSARGPEQAAFPLDQILERRMVMADLYGDADSLDRDVAMLRRLARPGYVVVRPGAPTAPFEARPDLFTRAYSADGFSVWAVAPAPGG